ncbi:MAG TPA: hypothetical protein VGR48_00575, partial [Terriglobales bacterium]|nr:hypothetical protein [Terriglobales bacterium]
VLVTFAVVVAIPISLSRQPIIAKPGFRFNNGITAVNPLFTTYLDDAHRLRVARSSVGLWGYLAG